MRRIMFALLCSCVLASLGLIAAPATPASAGDYYYGGGGYSGDGYYRSRYSGDGYYRSRYSGDGYYRSRYSGDGYYRSRYSDDGYYRPRRHHRSVWYSSNCCYRKIVRHERSVRYVPENYGYRSGYYDDGYYRRSYRSSYYDNGYRYGSYDRPYRSARYYNVGYSGYSGYSGNYGYGSCGRVRVADGRGGWVWGYGGCY